MTIWRRREFVYCPGRLVSRAPVMLLVSASNRQLYRQNSLKPSGHYMYRTVVTICTAQWSLYVPHSGHYTVQWSLYVPHSGHCMYRTVVTICTAQWSPYVPHSGHYMYHQFNIHQFYVLPTHCIYVFCGSQNIQPLFPYTTLSDWFL
jgi:hypothetical protein